MAEEKKEGEVKVKEEKTDGEAKADAEVKAGALLSEVKVENAGDAEPELRQPPEPVEGAPTPVPALRLGKFKRALGLKGMTRAEKRKHEEDKIKRDEEALLSTMGLTNDEIEELAELAVVPTEVMRRVLINRARKDKAVKEAEHFNTLAMAKAKAAEMKQRERELKEGVKGEGGDGDDKEAEEEKKEEEEEDDPIKKEVERVGATEEQIKELAELASVSEDMMRDILAEKRQKNKEMEMGEEAAKQKVEKAKETAAADLAQWTDGIDPKSGRRYYFNTANKTSHWEPPPGYVPKAPQPTAPAPAQVSAADAAAISAGAPAGGGGWTGGVQQPVKMQPAAPAGRASVAGRGSGISLMPGAVPGALRTPAPATVPSQGAAAWVLMTSQQFQGRQYWYNTATGASSWVRPPGV